MRTHSISHICVDSESAPTHDVSRAAPFARELLWEWQMVGRQVSFVCLNDLELSALIGCAKHHLTVITPGLSQSVATVLSGKWRQLGAEAVQIVLDPDPEVCRLGWGEFRALELLYSTATELGAIILEQQGLRLGLVITDETTTVFAPTPLLIEAGGKPGERRNAIRIEVGMSAPGVDQSEQKTNLALPEINLPAVPLKLEDVAKTRADLETNPPIKFDVARKVTIFNSAIEFVEFNLHGAAISRKTVPIPADLMGFARQPEVQGLLRSSFRLIAKDTDDISGDHIVKLKESIVKQYLIVLPKHGTVILRSNKAEFETAVQTLKAEIEKFQEQVKERVQAGIEANREKLLSALLVGVVANPPDRWKRLIGSSPTKDKVEWVLRKELAEAFGSAADVFHDMEVKVVFKGVTHESLTDPAFIAAIEKILPPGLGPVHQEFEAAPAGARQNSQSVSHAGAS